MEKIKAKAAKKITAAVKKIVGQKAPAPASRPSVSQDEFYRRVQEKAHEIFANRGGQHGNDLNDWYEAEKIVRAEMKAGL
jgi:hypothetical protein